MDILFVVLLISYISYKLYMDKKEDKLKKYLHDITDKEYDLWKREEALKTEKNKFMSEYEHQKKELEYQQFEFQKLVDDTSQSSPWLANKIADYFQIQDLAKSNYLKKKSHPAYKASAFIKEVSKEKRELMKNNKMLQYQLDFFTSTFPWLEDAMQLETTELQDAVNDITSSEEIKNDYEILSTYLSPEEYQKLSHIDKYQLALDRYLNKPKKSLWEIGISYERYIGYIYENKKYKVTYNGALEGFGDLGRDIIAENEKEILIIQCKYWRKERIIHEKHIFQLYGTMILKQLETNKKVVGIFVTTSTLSPNAKIIAEHLNIKVKENENFDKTYPCIKCNINKSTGERIYHLPFDQQYDRINITIDKGEKYVKTVEEAEKSGFRRAKRHFYEKEA